MYSGTIGPTATVQPPSPRDMKRELTAGYESATAFAYMQPRKLPPWSLSMADWMRMDHQVWFGLCVSNAPLMTAQVKVDGPNKQVNQFVAEQWERIWRTSAPKILQTKTYGYCGYEAVYRYEGDHWEFDHLLDRHPRDVKPLIDKETKRLVGVSVTHSGRAAVNGPVKMLAPKGIWLTYAAEFGQHFGRALLERAYPAWHDKAMAGGAYDLRRLRVLKDSWIGDRFRYPEEDVIFPDGTRLSGRDVARQIGENRTSGAALALPSTKYENGDYKWAYEPPSVVAGENQAQLWLDQLDDDIFDGLLLPKEVVEAATTGSGFSGRSIPMLAFLSMRDVEFASYVEDIDTQIIQPLVRLRYGKDSDDYDIKPRPLSETFGEQVGQGPAGGAVGQGQPQQPRDGLDPGSVQVGQQRLGMGASQFAADWDESDHPRDDDGTFKLANAPSGKKKSAEFHNKKTIQKNLIDGLDALPGQKDLFEERPSMSRPDPNDEGWKDEHEDTEPGHFSHYEDWEYYQGDERRDFRKKRLSAARKLESLAKSNGWKHYRIDATAKSGSVYVYFGTDKKQAKIRLADHPAGPAAVVDAEWYPGVRLQRLLDDAATRARLPMLADQFDVDPGSRWITIGGPKALRGKHVSQVGEHFKAEREGRTKEGKGRFHDEKGPSRNWKEIVNHQAERWDISPEEYESAADEVWRDKIELMQVRESAKADARGRLGITAGDVARLENKGIDSGSKSAAKGLDTVGRTLAGEYPELGWGQGYNSGDDLDYGALVWDLIREGKQTIPSRTSQDYHEAVEEYLEYAMTQTASSWKPDPAAQFSVGTTPEGRAIASDIRRRLGKLLQRTE